ncbi:MAG: hypothetical protein AB9828_07100 [Sphaerochaetaceae bacterium]|jgi:quercetin dioxygenase-like cupin family protein
MIEQIRSYMTTEDQTIEQLVQDPLASINHMVLPKGGSIPALQTYSTAYMMVTEGILGLRLDRQREHLYSKGSIITIPAYTTLSISCRGGSTMKLFMIKPNEITQPIHHT